ncbi:MAG: amino acid ABC transporter permease [Lachnospiraceae bacterium]|nr:amino acid ABC transporter permease [Lachnospiraceae bacterium]
MSGFFSLKAWHQVWTYRETFELGLLNTVETALVGVLLSLVLGIFFGLMATSGKKWLKCIARIYVEVIQNTPVLLQICFLYYSLAFSGHSMGIIATGMISLGIYTGAYMAEVFRAGIEAIPGGQFEAAHAQGFGYVGMMYHIILPQSIKIILPPAVNQVVNLIKNTSCLYIIGGADLISQTYNFVTGATTGGAYAPAYLVCGVLFFIICFPLSKMASAWEMNLKKRDQKMAVSVKSRKIVMAETGERKKVAV